MLPPLKKTAIINYSIGDFGIIDPFGSQPFYIVDFQIGDGDLDIKNINFFLTSE